MVIVGGEANSDLRDVWCLDLDTYTWYKPEVQGIDTYTPKRFHTVTTVSDSKIITFGGCHSEYVHMNELHIFDMSSFFEDPTDINKMIACTKVNTTEGVPSTRWGHSSASLNGKLYILGGRNEHDIIDLHEFNPEDNKWNAINIV